MKEVLSRPVRENDVNEAMCGRQVTPEIISPHKRVLRSLL